MAPKPLSQAIPLGVLGALITVENMLVCYLVYRYKILRTFTNGFVVSLALSDVLFGCLLLPMNIADEKHPANLYLVCIILFANVTNLLAVTLDRYLAILHPLVYTYKMTKYFVRILIVTWAIPVPVALLPLAWKNDDKRVESTVYLFFIVIGGVILPYVLILFVYILIFREVARQVRNLSRLKKYTDKFKEAAAEGKRVSGEARVARIFAVIAGIFVVSWGPVIYMTAAVALHAAPAPKEVVIISWYTMAIGSLANAAMYAFFKADFRRAFLKLFGCRANSNESMSMFSVTSR